MAWIFDLFKKKAASEALPPVLLSFALAKDVKGSEACFSSLSIKDKPAFFEFIRNNTEGIDTTTLGDDEIAHLFLCQYSMQWISKNFRQSLLVESHTLQSNGEAKYDRMWTAPFIAAIKQLGLAENARDDAEAADMYMDYVYGTRLMAIVEEQAKNVPASPAHPMLTDPANTFKD